MLSLNAGAWADDDQNREYVGKDGEALVRHFLKATKDKKGKLELADWIDPVFLKKQGIDDDWSIERIEHVSVKKVYPGTDGSLVMAILERKQRESVVMVFSIVKRSRKTYLLPSENQNPFDRLLRTPHIVLPVTEVIAEDKNSETKKR